MTISGVLIATLVFLNVLDGFMTYKALEHRGKIEKNPIMVWLFNKLSVRFGVILAKGLAVVAVMVLPLHLYVLIGLTMWYVALTANNVYHYNK